MRACMAAACIGAWVTSCTGANAAGLYRCTDARGVTTYAQQPCPDGDTLVVPVDRALPLTRDTAAPKDAPRAGALSGHRLTPPERQRLARLRREEADLPAEARTAADIEIAAIREGVDANISRGDRATLDVLRAQLRAADAPTRSDALAHWRMVYARYRIPAHPRVQPMPAPIGNSESVPPIIPEPPLGASIPGSRGPLTVTPGEASAGIPSRPGPVADPASGRVLAPAGTDRLVDPMTGTLWMRSGRVYVDPASGRIIPAP